VILRPGESISAAELRDFCIERLGRFKAPKAITIVEELPRGPSGKVQRLKLIERLSAVA